MIPAGMSERPFWDASYSDLSAPDPFGEPSEELVALASVLRPGAAVIDLGCGEGRHALYLAEREFRVTAVDLSEAAIRKLQHHAAARGLRVDAQAEDLCTYSFPGSFDLVIAHGVLHLLKPPDRDGLLARMQAHTRCGGYNVVVAFTDTLPPPEDLAPLTRGLLHEGELFERYADWEVLRAESYLLEDEHPGGIRHRHPINKLVARRLPAPRA